MYLKSLQLVGFKSFADKTRFEFPPGVTAIVGPNGCGKSNVLDGIRWVLGEQSAKALRGGEMTDVIFSGTDRRKQIGMAEVAMTFADCDSSLGTEFHEITIVRRLFRDGKSEYEINKTPCRLRDIHQIFMDTGIGRTAYSIMEQGKIDKIISAKPEDRREVFEEAAGITRFKSQKREALRKLEHTEANLLRVADIIREIKRQIGSLQRQAGKARRYKEIYEQLRTIELQLGRHKMRELLARIAELDSKHAALSAKVEILTVDLSKHELELQDQRDQAARLGADLETGQRRQAELRSATERAQAQIEFNRERLTALDAADEAAHRTIRETEERLNVHTSQRQHTDEQLASVRSEIEATRNALSSAQDALSSHAAQTKQLRDQLAAHARELQSVDAQLDQLRAQLAGRDAETQALLLRREALQSDRDRVAALIQSAQAARAELDAKLADARARRETLRHDLDQRVARQRERAQHADSVRQERDQLERQRLTDQSQHDLLVRLMETHEGFSPGVQNVLAAAAAGRLPNLPWIKTLTDEIDVAEGNQRAAEALLGVALQALVLADSSAVRDVLALLATIKSDRVALAPVAMPRMTWNCPRRFESALNFISGSPSVQPVLQALLGCSYICDTLDEALGLKRDLPHAQVATRDGLLISSDGLVYAGAEAGQAELLSRKHEIARLATCLADHTTRIQQVSERFDSAESERLAAERATDETRRALREAEEAASALDRDSHGALRQLEELQRQAASLESDVTRLDQTGRQADERHATQLQSREQIDARRHELLALRGTIESNLPAAADEEARLNAVLTEQRVQIATLEEKRNGLEHQIQTAEARARELQESLATHRTELETNQSKRLELRTQNDSLQSQLAQTDAARSETHAALAHIQERRTALIQSADALDTALRSSRRALDETQHLRGAAELELARKRMDADNLKDRLHRTYQINIEEEARDASLPDADPRAPASLLPSDDAAPDTRLPPDPEASAPESVSESHAEQPEPVRPELQPEFAWESLEEQAAELREKIDAMGPVNLEAIAEYEELEQRYTFYDTQQTDLLNSKDDLLKAITHINKTTQQLFADTFAEIRANFQKTFLELFGGGKADLILADDADPLECGIEIMAKPPGKQLQSISLLSGGERTMTAVALLFAIYMVKPSPFCILDEMDAPLDESNIGRFLEMLKRFTTQSQFLLITHNKKTISIADALYGVTMEESGVSKIVSVRFTRAVPPPGPNGSAPTPAAHEPAVASDRSAETSAAAPTAAEGLAASLEDSAVTLSPDEESPSLSAPLASVVPPTTHLDVEPAPSEHLGDTPRIDHG